ncbi:hypothetical protein GCM10022238_28400 [Gordonia hankookensis]
MPVLPDHRDPPPRVAGDHRDRAEVFDDLTFGDAPTGHLDLVDPQGENRTVVNGSGPLDGERVLPVDCVVA